MSDAHADENTLPTPVPNDSQIRELLTQYRSIAVVGLSPKADRPSHGVTRYLISQGYEICGIRPGGAKILDRPVYGSLTEVPGPLEIVDVFRSSDAVPEIVDQVIALGAKVLWLQEGVTSPEAEARARAAGIWVISDRCILKEHRRLGI